MNNTNEAVLREALETLYQMTSRYAISDTDYGIVCNAAAALAATATVAKDCGEPIDYAGDFVKLAIDEAEKRGLDYVSTRILRALLAKYSTPQPEASAEQPAGDLEARYLLRHCLPVIRKHGVKSLVVEVQDYLATPISKACATCDDTGYDLDGKSCPSGHRAPISEDTGKANSSSAAPSDERGKFEAWAMPCYILDREEDNTYSGRGAYIAWSAWQFRAALAAPSPTRESLSARKAVLEEVANYLADVHSITLANEIRALKTVPGEPT